MAKIDVKTYAETSSQNGDTVEITKDKKYDLRPRYLSRRLGRILMGPVGGTEWEGETNQYGKKSEDKYEREERPNREYTDALIAEQNYRKTHGGHSRIGSILRDGYKEPERDKNELQDYEIEARRED